MTGTAPEVISPVNVVGIVGIVCEGRGRRDGLVGDLCGDHGVTAKGPAAAMRRGTLGQEGVVEFDNNRSNYGVGWDIFVRIVDTERDSLVGDGDASRKLLGTIVMGRQLGGMVGTRSGMAAGRDT